MLRFFRFLFIFYLIFRIKFFNSLLDLILIFRIVRTPFLLNYLIIFFLWGLYFLCIFLKIFNLIRWKFWVFDWLLLLLWFFLLLLLNFTLLKVLLRLFAFHCSQSNRTFLFLLIDWWFIYWWFFILHAVSYWYTLIDLLNSFLNGYLVISGLHFSSSLDYAPFELLLSVFWLLLTFFLSIFLIA
mgnify:CR=1 FL=1